MVLYYTLIIIYLILFAALSARRIEWAVYLVVFALPSYLIRFKVGWLPMTLLEAMILILFLAWWIKTIKYRGIKTLKQVVLNHKFLFIWCGVFLMSATVAMLIGPDLRAAAGIWKAYFIEPILFLIVFVRVVDKRDVKTVFKILFFQAVLLSLVAIYQKMTGDFIPNDFWAAEATRRVTSVFGYPNALALYMAPIITIFLGLWVKAIEENKIKKMLISGSYFIVVVLGSAAVYFSGSKGALLGVFMGIIFYFLLYKAGRKYFIWILLIIISIGVYAWQTGKINLTGNPTVKGGDSLSVRLEMWQETYQLLKDHPFLGTGLAGYQKALIPYHQKEYIEIYLYPHNILLNFWLELGLAGLLSFLLIIVWFYKIGFKNRENAYSIILMAGMTTLLVHGLVDVPYFKNDLSLLFWLLIGMLVAEQAGENREKMINRV